MKREQSRRGSALVILFAAIAFAALARPVEAQSRPTPAVGQIRYVVFAQRPRPNGIETDSAGNVYLQWDKTFSYALTSFAPTGAVRKEVSVGTFQVGSFEGHIARIPNTNAMLLMSNNGLIYAFGPDLAPVLAFNLTSLYFQVANDVYDVSTGLLSSFTLGIPTGVISRCFASRPAFFTCTSRRRPVPPAAIHSCSGSLGTRLTTRCRGEWWRTAQQQQRLMSACREGSR